jgi:hypothetical protein
MPAAVIVGLVNLLAAAFLLSRFGLLGASGSILASTTLQTALLTAHPTAWYFPQSAVAVGCLLGLAAFCCWTATGGKRPFTDGFFADE